VWNSSPRNFGGSTDVVRADLAAENVVHLNHFGGRGMNWPRKTGSAEVCWERLTSDTGVVVDPFKTAQSSNLLDGCTDQLDESGTIGTSKHRFPNSSSIGSSRDHATAMQEPRLHSIVWVRTARGGYQ
jgi:hypothetical protein